MKCAKWDEDSEARDCECCAAIVQAIESKSEKITDY